MKKFDKKEQLKNLKIILIIIWMITIFVFSAQQGTESGNTSRKFTVIIIEILTGKTVEANDPVVEGIQLFVRKAAHFTIYTIGGFLIMNYANSTDKTHKQKLLHSIIFGTCYAITDEIHQLFVPGRSGNIFDVGIDTLGIICGVLICVLIQKVMKRVRNNHKVDVI